MCGIAGILNLDRDAPAPDAGLLRAMVGALHHRGPDECGGYRDPDVGLGHARLSIIDLATGTQPLCNEDGTVWIVFNGEVFNYVELAQELRALGHRLATRSDTEVIVHAYEQWGEACVERFNGQFAFAIWDRPRRRLLLARDRVGIRPLYYAVVGRHLLFGSECKAILCDPEAPRGVDLSGLAQVLTFWAPVAPATVLQGVRQLRPGSTLVVEQGAEPRERVYWRPRFVDADRPRAYASRREVDEAADGLRDRLEEATRLRMLRADVPVGVYLSGGIDSSVIGALVRRFHAGELSTFSVRFAQRDFDERGYQDQMVARLGTDHRSVEVGYGDIAGALPDVVWHAECPILRSAPAPLYRLSGLVREAGFKVVLTGEGADEFLAGYDLFREGKVRRFWARNPESAWRALLLSRLYPWMARSPAQAKALQRTFFGQGMEHLKNPHFSHIPRWNNAQGLLRLLHPEVKAAVAAGPDPAEVLLEGMPPEVRGWEPVGQAQYVEIITLLSGYLLSSQGDRMLMGHSVEGRFPFLDHNVMEYANALPPEAKLRVLDEKHVLKRAARDLVPDAILHRPKQPYRAPDAQSFVQDDRPAFVDELLDAPAVERAGLFNPRAVSMLLGKCIKMRDKTPSNTDNMALMAVLSTQLLHHQLIQGRRSPHPAPEHLDRWEDRVEET